MYLLQTWQIKKLNNSTVTYGKLVLRYSHYKTICLWAHSSEDCELSHIENTSKTSTLDVDPAYKVSLQSIINCGKSFLHSCLDTPSNKPSNCMVTAIYLYPSFRVHLARYMYIKCYLNKSEIPSLDLRAPNIISVGPGTLGWKFPWWAMLVSPAVVASTINIKIHMVKSSKFFSMYNQTIMEMYTSYWLGINSYECTKFW